MRPKVYVTGGPAWILLVLALLGLADVIERMIQTIF